MSNILRTFVLMEGKQLLIKDYLEKEGLEVKFVNVNNTQVLEIDLGDITIKQKKCILKILK
tara:strand:+ start:2385 stop:2567 length:183 start_codon:yes stop_codon:yes gene_type:complete